MCHFLLRHVRQHQIHAGWFVAKCRIDESCVSKLQLENRSDESIDRSRARNVVNEVASSDVVKSAYDCVRLGEKEWRSDVSTIKNEETRGRRTSFLYPDPFAPSLTRLSTSDGRPFHLPWSSMHSSSSCRASSISSKQTYEQRAEDDSLRLPNVLCRTDTNSRRSATHTHVPFCQA